MSLQILPITKERFQQDAAIGHPVTGVGDSAYTLAGSLIALHGTVTLRVLYLPALTTDNTLVMNVEKKIATAVLAKF
ncbi:hypothetical protein [Fodinicola feengrottensis]|uniref:hypothetical protein n=1 Tax=Fodinicola feengrottensis TaxID=435914 RepID=UPI0013D2F573|nr:hypothetical protein [Fodinicola feengrottensis]